MENPEKFFCKWDTCRAEFSSQLDMGLHVLTNHLEILDYGHFVLQKSVVKAPEEPAAKKPRIEAPESSRTFLEPRESFPTSSELQFPRLQDSRKCSRVLELEDETEYVENSVGEKTKIPRQMDSDDAVAMPILEKIVPVETSRKVREIRAGKMLRNGLEKAITITGNKQNSPEKTGKIHGKSSEISEKGLKINLKNQ
ncbi:Protein CBG20380 [Caenorhabditis briggsae]|uniref:Protein CBG20380 n=1 Tax=Caenorhabditis briggsae TaxID=6238 RepID=A8XXN1_CAEBR|nr:Protein CBG20380 [Caenorhabditis briggsae]CAP37400.2 Protein CBG20380 [Caenorhabditis briggsae]